MKHDPDDGSNGTDGQNTRSHLNNFTSGEGPSTSVDRQRDDRPASADDGGHPRTVIEHGTDDGWRPVSLDRRPQWQQAHGRSSPMHGHPSSTISSSTSSRELVQQPSVTMRDLIRVYEPLLCCPACSPPSRLVAPTTLHCGHTVCARHVRTEVTRPSPSSGSYSAQSTRPPVHHETNRPHSAPADQPPPVVPVVPSCPLPTCQPRAREQIITPRIPPGSTVAYYPPIPQPAAGVIEFNRVTVPEPRPDVSLGRVLLLLDKAEVWEESRKDEHSDTDESDGTDEDYQSQASEDALAGLDSQASTPSGRRSRRRSRRTSNARKRSRRDEYSDGSHHRHTTHEELEDRFKKDLMESLTCEICFVLLYQPVTTPCQHTFCAKCLQRSLDHGTRCPLCRQEMPPFSYFQDHPFNKVVLAVLLKAFPDGYSERGRAIEEEERDGRLNTPIFVCQLAFPGIPTLLHFYEPRYRLMLRRCLESPTPCFGMIMPQRTVGAGFSDYGTMLAIRSVQMLPDGRSMVETIGTHRFRIMENGTLDGYMVGRIERIDDIPHELEEEAERSISSLLASRTNNSEGSSSIASPFTIPSPTTKELIAICHAFVEQLRNGTAPWVVERLNNTYGPMPSEVNSFSFWIAQVLPIEEHEKAKLLVIRSARARLLLVVHWIEQLNSNW